MTSKRSKCSPSWRRILMPIPGSTVKTFRDLTCQRGQSHRPIMLTRTLATRWKLPEQRPQHLRDDSQFSHHMHTHTSTHMRHNTRHTAQLPHQSKNNKVQETPSLVLKIKVREVREKHANVNKKNWNHAHRLQADSKTMWENVWERKGNVIVLSYFFSHVRRSYNIISHYM